jgi:hypothetical protein
MRPEIAWSALPRVVGAATLGASVLAIPDLADVVRLALALVLYLGGLLLLRAVPMEILEQLPSWSRAA